VVHGTALGAQPVSIACAFQIDTVPIAFRSEFVSSKANTVSHYRFNLSMWPRGQTRDAPARAVER